DERGKVKLSMRVVDQATGADITDQVGAKPSRGPERGDRPEREERGDRGGFRGDRPRRDREPVHEGTDQPTLGD
ncbi:MAG: polyribonucleotide nucleotidyltransferase, partial [Rhodopila sp.]|nr:polyribonucleotide nucleotidyltransferase [Rhodopila sp.]